MATKYVRKSYQNPSRAGQKGEGRRPFLGTADPRHRLLRIYIGIGMFTGALYVFHFTGLNSRLEWKPATEGPGIVVAKDMESGESAEPRYFIDIAVDIPIGEGERTEGGAHTRRVVDHVETTKENFQSVEQGTVVVVRYQAAYAGDKIKIQEIVLPGATGSSETNQDDVSRVAPNPEIR